MIQITLNNPNMYIESKINSFKDLIVWQKSMTLVKLIYELTANFPKEERYGLTAQIRKAAVSIPSNISEGSRRGSRREFRQFLLIAYGSGSEVETQLEIAKALHFITNLTAHQTESLLDEVMRMLNKMTESLRSSTNS